MATYHLDLDFTAICSEYADGWSMEDIHSLGESLTRYAMLPARRLGGLRVGSKYQCACHLAGGGSR